MAKTPSSTSTEGGEGSIPGQGAKILHAVRTCPGHWVMDNAQASELCSPFFSEAKRRKTLRTETKDLKS